MDLSDLFQVNAVSVERTNFEAQRINAQRRERNSNFGGSGGVVSSLRAGGSPRLSSHGTSRGRRKHGVGRMDNLIGNRQGDGDVDGGGGDSGSGQSPAAIRMSRSMGERRGGGKMHDAVTAVRAMAPPKRVPLAGVMRKGGSSIISSSSRQQQQQQHQRQSWRRITSKTKSVEESNGRRAPSMGGGGGKEGTIYGGSSPMFKVRSAPPRLAPLGNKTSGRVAHGDFRRGGQRGASSSLVAPAAASVPTDPASRAAIKRTYPLKRPPPAKFEGAGFAVLGGIPRGSGSGPRSANSNGNRGATAGGATAVAAVDMSSPAHGARALAEIKRRYPPPTQPAGTAPPGSPSNTRVYLTLGHTTDIVYDRDAQPLTPPPGTPKEGTYTHLRFASMLDLTCRQHVKARLARLAEARAQREARNAKTRSEAAKAEAKRARDAAKKEKSRLQRAQIYRLNGVMTRMEAAAFERFRIFQKEHPEARPDAEKELEERDEGDSEEVMSA